MILHIDMDAFYASVEERDRPELVGKPVIVGGDPARRGVVSAANYVARQYGVHSAMPAATARRQCPHAVFLKPRLAYYADVSSQIRAIFDRYTPLVETLSLDEAFLDVRGSIGLFGPPAEIGRAIKGAIRQELRLVASVGVAPNKFLAKIASDLRKPDGFVVVPPEGVQEFLDPLPVSRLWGVGKVSNATLERMGIRTIGQLRQLPAEVLRERFGSVGDHLSELAHGIDPRPVVPDQEAKSISHETTFEIDLADPALLRAWLQELTELVARRLRRHKLRGRTVQLKVRFADFQTITRSQTLPEPTNRTEELWQAAAELLETRLPADHPPVRLLGMGVSGFDHSPYAQQLLFDSEERQRQSRLDAVTDQIAARYGHHAIGRAKRISKDQP
jgi:DNA polymerase-4